MTIERSTDGTFFDTRARVAIALPGKPKNRPLRRLEKLSLQQISRRCQRILEREKIAPGLDYFSYGTLTYIVSDAPGLPLRHFMHNYRWIACYAVTGGSEGHYVHVDLIGHSPTNRTSDIGERRQIFNVKTFGGMEEAQRIAARLAVLLDA